MWAVQHILSLRVFKRQFLEVTALRRTRRKICTDNRKIRMCSYERALVKKASLWLDVVRGYSLRRCRAERAQQKLNSTLIYLERMFGLGNVTHSAI